MELVDFVGRLASVGLQLEGCHSLLLSFILDFYETVNDLMLVIESALWLSFRNDATCALALLVLFKDPLHSNMCFAYCYFTWMFELHFAE